MHAESTIAADFCGSLKVGNSKRVLESCVMRYVMYMHNAYDEDAVDDPGLNQEKVYIFTVFHGMRETGFQEFPLYENDSSSVESSTSHRRSSKRN